MRLRYRCRVCGVKRLPLLVIVALLAFAVGRVTSGASADVPYAFAPVPPGSFAPVQVPVVQKGGVLTEPDHFAVATVTPPAVTSVTHEPIMSAPASRHSIRGISSWYATGPGGLTAAAGPALRVGDWRGRIVIVCAGACIAVRIVDWCACPRRLIDLSRDAFARLADPSRGLLEVTARW